MANSENIRLSDGRATLDVYLNEISKYAKITPDEEFELAEEIERGNRIAFERAVHANLHIVVEVAKKYQNQGLDLSDLINEGNLGLIKAVQRFKISNGYRLIPYATWWIRQSILQALAEQAHIVKIPQNRASSISRAKKTFATLEQRFEREPTIDELAEEMELDPDNVKEALLLSANNRYLNLPDQQHDTININGSLLPEPQRPDNVLITESLRNELERILRTLNCKEAQVVRLYFGINDNQPLSLEEIGAKLGISSERVRQIKETSLQKIKKRSKLLKAYLG